MMTFNFDGTVEEQQPEMGIAPDRNQFDVYMPPLPQLQEVERQEVSLPWHHEERWEKKKDKKKK